jgi:endonuclease/exonuclease/phosphatase family metal-dependent hydrolase
MAPMRTLRLLTWNIRYGGEGREADLAATIRAAGPDVVLLQEATRPAVVEAVARATGMAQWGTSHRQSLGFLAREPVQHFEWRQPRVSRHAFLDRFRRAAGSTSSECTSVPSMPPGPRPDAFARYEPSSTR